MNRIKELRERKNISQKSLAIMANVSQPYLHDLEKGARGAKPETFERIASALQVPVETIFDTQKAG